MTRELILLRHAEADYDAKAKDFQRPLKDSGKRAAQRVGIWLQQRHLIPDLILSSSAVRASETAQKCAKAMGIGSHTVRRLDDLYLAGSATLLDVLHGCPPSAGRVLLVAHNPGLERVIDELRGRDKDRDTPPAMMQPASLTHFKTTGDWSEMGPKNGQLVQQLHASELPSQFPYPGPFGRELRDRPAYYYTQSAVIPYKDTVKGRRVLIVRSSKNKHWVVPKGIADPGMTLQESAAKEAIEEAGVEGHIHPASIGSYITDKWGGQCKVTVYPMQVTRELPEDEWEERHRGRSWVSPKKAAELLKEKALGKLALHLKD